MELVATGGGRFAIRWRAVNAGSHTLVFVCANAVLRCSQRVEVHADGACAAATLLSVPPSGKILPMVWSSLQLRSAHARRQRLGRAVAPRSPPRDLAVPALSPEVDGARPRYPLHRCRDESGNASEVVESCRLAVKCEGLASTANLVLRERPGLDGAYEVPI